LLSINNIEVVYDRVILVLKGVSIDVREGAITTLLGANGAGKTTTLKAISGVLRSERGEVTKGAIELAGRRIDGMRAHEVTKLGLVQVFERGKLVWSPQGEPSLALVGAEYAARQHNPATVAARAAHACRTSPPPPEAMVGPIAGDARPACLDDAAYFPETQHTLRGAFATFWAQHGGLAQFGYPISEEFTLQGQVVQYFERARFELGPRGEVRLTRVGADLYGR